MVSKPSPHFPSSPVEKLGELSETAEEFSSAASADLLTVLDQPNEHSQSPASTSTTIFLMASS
jgi:hypothetical protein